MTKIKTTKKAIKLVADSIAFLTNSPLQVDGVQYFPKRVERNDENIKIKCEYFDWM